jgi:hypothetical protein
MLAFRQSLVYVYWFLAPTEVLWDDIALNVTNCQPITRLGNSLLIPVRNRDVFRGLQDGGRFIGLHLQKFSAVCLSSPYYIRTCCISCFILPYLIPSFFFLLFHFCLFYLPFAPSYFIYCFSSLPSSSLLLLFSLHFLSSFFNFLLLSFFLSSLVPSHILFYLYPFIHPSFVIFNISFFFSHFL